MQVVLSGGRVAGAIGNLRWFRTLILLLFATASLSVIGATTAAALTFSRIVVEGNERIEPTTIQKVAGIGTGQTVSEAELNDAVQRLVASGLFASVDLVPSGNTLIIKVTENPVINIVNFEGNKLIDDETLAGVVQSKSRRVYSVAQVEADAAAIVKAYADAGRLAARVEPRVIDRGDNRVDLAFEIREGKITEIERLSFTGNRSYSDRRLRQVLETKQAGLLRQIIQRDTYVADRIEFDKQLLTDFYRERGFIDFQVLSVTREFSRERDGFFLTFALREGLSYRFGNISAVSEYEGIDVAPYQDVIRIRKGVTYSPTAVDITISRMEAIALKQGVNFMNIVPRITRNERDQTLDIVFALTKGPRVFVERIDIQGNTTTLDKVIRRQFRTVEGDPFSPREIREGAERVRALNFFETADVNAKQGTGPDQVIVDVNVEEKPTGSLTFGASYSVGEGGAINLGLSEANFLGRGQYVSLNLSAGTNNKNSSVTFIEPAFLGRDLKFRFNAYYRTTANDNSDYSTNRIGGVTGLEFPISELGKLELRYSLSSDEIHSVSTSSSVLLQNEEARGAEISSSLGYTYSYDTRIGGIDPNRAMKLTFGQDFAGVGGDIQSVKTTASATFQQKIMREEVVLRAELEGGNVTTTGGDSRLVDRFTGNGIMRGFAPNGIGPRDLGAVNEDAVGGNYFAAARFEAEFPLGLPEEYGLRGGAFADFGSVWGLDNTAGTATIDDGMYLRSSIGLSLFWDTAIGPLRFNFSRAINKESYDKVQNFDLTISTQF
jgi:outer membrane protein insertion porin family